MNAGRLPWLDEAQRHHRAGRLEEAADLYRRVLAQQPTHGEALYLLGAVRLQQGNHAEAITLNRQAIADGPRELAAQASLNLGAACAALGQLEEAVAAFRQAAALKPGFAEAEANLTTALTQLGRPATHASELAAGGGEAESPEARNRQGASLLSQNRPAEALASLDRALALKPASPGAFLNRGNVLRELGRPEDAVASYDRAIAVKPDYADAFINRGNVLREMRRFAEAIASYDAALTLQPDNPIVGNNRGVALAEMGRFPEATESYQSAIALRPDYATAHFNLGSALAMQGRTDEALAHHAKTLALRPDFTKARFAMCTAQLPILYRDEDEIDRRRTAYEAQLNALSDEVAYGAVTGDLVGAVAELLPFYLPYQARNDRELQQRFGSLACHIVAARCPPAALPPPPVPAEPVRVGIVSGFFRDHSVYRMPIEGWLVGLDRRRFRVFGYHTGGRRDGDTAAAAQLCERFVQGPLPLERWRAEIAADAPHVLIYPAVGMDAPTALLAAHRLAPVQCNSWGHPETSGFPTLDYFLSSALMEPPEAQDHYTERLVRLPNLSVWLDPPEAPELGPTRAELGLRRDAVVFWCGQSLFKYLPQFDAVFPRIARAAGNCQFAFIEFPNARYVTDLFRERLDRAFAAHGLRAADYCVIWPRTDPRAYAAALGRCDIALDSIEWSGCNTILDALAFDLPVVTLPGALMRGRHAAAFLQMMGVTETVAGTLDEYIAIAARLAADRSWRSAVQGSIRINRQRLYRDRACITGLEAFLDRVARHPGILD